MKLYKEASLMMLPTSVKDGKLYSIFPQPRIVGDNILTEPLDIDADFDAHGGGVIVDANTFTTAGGSFDGIKATIFEVGKKYKLEIKGTTTSNGFTIGNLALSGNEYGSGFGVHYFVAGEPRLWIRQTTAGTTDITTFTIKEVDQLPADFDFSRGADRATRVNEQGLVRPVEIVSDELVQNGDFEEIGDELITNGGFDTDSDWTLTQSTISEGSLQISTTDGSFSGARQFNTFTVGKNYLISLEISDIVGTVEVDVNSGSGYGQNFTSNGTHSFYLYATNTDIEVKRAFGAEQIISASIDNISVKEVGQNWTFGTGWSIEDNGGNLKAISDTTQSNLTSDATLVSGKKYKFSLSTSSVSAGSYSFLLRFNTTNTSIGEVNSDGSHEFIVEADSTSFRLQTLSGATTSFLVDNISVVEVTEATDLPRLDWSGDCPVLLLEPQRTNLIDYSEYFSQWQNGGGTQTIVANSTTSPQGLQNASSIQIDSGYVYKQVSGLSVLSGDKYTWSCYVNSASQKITFGGGSVAGTDVYSSEDSGNGWYRQKLTRTFTTSGSIIQPMFLDSISGTDLFYIWGAQLEEGSYATSYIPTRGQSATRAADTTNSTGLDISDFHDGEDFTLFIDLAKNESLVRDNSDGGIRISTQNATASSLRIYRASSSATTNRVVWFDNDSVQLPTPVQIFGDSPKVVIRRTYENGEWKVFVNGSVVSTQTNTNYNPMNNVKMWGAGSPQEIKQLTLFDKALSDNECINLTTI